MDAPLDPVIAPGHVVQLPIVARTADPALIILVVIDHLVQPVCGVRGDITFLDFMDDPRFKVARAVARAVAIADVLGQFVAIVTIGALIAAGRLSTDAHLPPLRGGRGYNSHICRDHSEHPDFLAHLSSPLLDDETIVASCNGSIALA